MEVDVQVVCQRIMNDGESYELEFALVPGQKNVQGGHVKMHTNNKAVADEFTKGAVYEVGFKEVPKA
jgi:hypothetical protein